MNAPAPEKFDFNLIRYLVAIVETRSMVNAADILDVAPSAVSYAVKKLRSYYSDPLFIRGLNGVTPTVLALNLYDRFKLIHADIMDTLQLEPTSASTQRTLYVRAEPMTELWVMNRLLQEKIVPDECVINFRKPSYNLATREQRLRVQEIDLDIGVSIAGDRNIISYTLFRSIYTIVCHENHKTIKESITREQFATLPYVAYNESFATTDARNDYHELLSSRVFEPVFRSGSPTTMLLSLLIEDFMMFIPTVFLPLLRTVLPIKEVKCDFLPKSEIAIMASINKKNADDKLLAKIINVLKV